MPAKFLYNLTEKLSAQSAHNLCAVLLKIKKPPCTIIAQRGRIIAVPPQFIRMFIPFHTDLKSLNAADVRVFRRLGGVASLLPPVISHQPMTL